MKCRYCRRTLRLIPHSAVEIEPHCERPGCLWCGECARGETSLFVDARCKELIADFEQVTYKDNTMEIDKNKDRRRTHLSDALGYLVCEEGNRPPVGERGFRLL